jgi:hypothetical protein
MVCYTVMEYLYRDADNFKSLGQVLLKGKFNLNDNIKIECFLYSGELFVAEQLDIPVLYSELWLYSNGITKADHVFHQFYKLRKASKADVDGMDLWGSVGDLFKKLKIINQDWDCSLSICQA